MNKAFVVIFVCLLATGCSGNGVATPSKGAEKPADVVSDPLRKKASAAKTQYQNELYQFFVDQAPPLGEVFEINRDLQIALIQLGDMRFEYLIETAPTRVPTTEGYLKWLNFEWTDDDEKLLIGSSASYADIQQRVSVLRTRNQGHAMWPEARTLFQEKQQDARMIEMNQQLQEHFDEIDAALNSQ